MENKLSNGDVVYSDNGHQYIVDKCIGYRHGSELYFVNRDDKQYRMMAYDFIPSSQYKSIINKLNSNFDENNINWPIEYVKNEKVIGIIEKYGGKEYKLCWDLAKKKMSPSFESLINACISLAKAFNVIHKHGLVFNSEPVLLLNPDNGEIFLDDYSCLSFISDNQSGFFGSYRYAAPEIITKEAGVSIDTDLYILSVLIFFLLMVSFPYDGKLYYNEKVLDMEAIMKLYGSPIYVFDKDDDSNRPHDVYNRNALLFRDIYPEFVFRTFETAFVDGAKNPSKRISGYTWIEMLSNLKSSMIRCDSCGASVFFKNDLKCWNCHKQVGIEKYDVDSTLCHKIILKYIEIIENNDVDYEIISNINRKGIVSLLSCNSFQNALLERKGFLSIYKRITGHGVAAYFNETDFLIDLDLKIKIENDVTSNEYALKLINRIYNECNEFGLITKIVQYLNGYVNDEVIESFKYYLEDNVIRKIYDICPEIINNRKKLKSYLMDFIPEDRKLQNVICLSFDENIPQELKIVKNVDNIILRKFKNRLTSGYDISEETADMVIMMWIDAILREE